jgi:hypothetical protein
VNQFTNQLDALARIVAAIKAYRNQMADYQDVVDNEAANTYLKQHLSVQDWAFWQQLQIREQVLLHTIKTGGS